MSKISDKKCPVCHALSDADINLVEFVFVREMELTNDIDNEKKYERYFPPENLVASTNNHVMIMQCPCCKTMFSTTRTFDNDETWKVRCQEVIDGYDWWDRNDKNEHHDDKQ